MLPKTSRTWSYLSCSIPPHVGQTYELSGPRSQDFYGLAEEYGAALGRSVTYVDVPLDEWHDRELRSRQLPDHVFERLLTMAQLHAADRYNRLSSDHVKYRLLPLNYLRYSAIKSAINLPTDRERARGAPCPAHWAP